MGTEKKKPAAAAAKKSVKPVAKKAPASSASAKQSTKATKPAMEKPKAESAKPAPAAKPSVSKPTAKPTSRPTPVAAKSAAPAAKATKVAKPVPAKAGKAGAQSDVDVHSFSQEYLVLMQKDPNWMHAFWEVSERRRKEAISGGRKMVLRLYDISSDLTVRTSRKPVQEIEVPADARSWYLQRAAGDQTLKATLGVVDVSGQFQPIVASVAVPSAGEASVPGGADGVFFQASLGGVQFGGFGSSQLGIPGLSSGALFPSSGALSSWASSSGAVSSGQWSGQVGPGGRGKDFFLWVRTRLIVYGGTRPDAHLQVRGQPFPLNPDGTFSLEMDLPDSTQVIPVFATDHEGDFPTTIVPIVVKRTE